MQPKPALRLLLRAIDRHVTSVAGNKQWRQHVVAQFRANADVVDLSQQQHLVLLAKEYADLISNIAHHQELLDTYNIGTDPDERNKQMVAKTAARVGFQLPNSGGESQPLGWQQQQQEVPEPWQQQQQQQADEAQDYPQQHQAHRRSTAQQVVAAGQVRLVQEQHHSSNSSSGGGSSI